MARKDLLSLTEDDLVLLSNRGTVKRCLREIEENEFTVVITEDQQENVLCHWSDGAACNLPANAALGAAQCSCPATGICRHLVRSVLAYQGENRKQSSPAVKPSVVTEPSAEVIAKLPSQISETGSGDDSTPDLPDVDKVPDDNPTGQWWSPGDMSDELIAKQIKPLLLKRAQKMFEAGQVVELITGQKPLARFFTVPASVRFLVPGDCRYTYCNCIEEAPCVHVPLAIWAFRRLSGRSAGIVDTAENKAAAPSELLNEMEILMREFTSIGLAGLAPAVTARFQKMRQKCEEQGLRWTSELLSELLEERDRYFAADALFSPEKVVDLVGEICARHDALVSRTKAVPSVFITGSSSDRPTDQASLRLIGLGCGVDARKNNSTITAFFQDDDSGYLVGIRRQYSTQDSTEDHRTFTQLASAAVVRNHSLHSLAAGQLLCKGGKLTTSRIFSAGRTTPLALNPQQYNWERLRFPVLVEGLTELRTLIAFQPPPYLGGRNPGRNLHVCPVNRIEDVRFSTAHQALIGTIIDPSGQRCALYHPYTSRGKAGLEATLQDLKDPRLRPVFIAGMFTTKASGLCVRPISIVVESGASRKLIQPWVDSSPVVPAAKATAGTEALTEEPATHPLQSFCESMEDALAEILIEGVERYSEHTVNRWRNLADHSAQLGFIDVTRALHRFFKALESQRHDANWLADHACKCLLDVCVIHLVMREVVFDAMAPATA